MSLHVYNTRDDLTRQDGIKREKIANSSDIFANNRATMYHYVTLFVLIALTASALGGPMREKIEAIKRECAESLGIDYASVEGPPKMDDNFMADTKMRCFGACMMKKFGKMNDDGTVNVDKMTAHLPPDMPDRERVVAAMEECGARKGENECETAYEIFQCFREKKVPMHPPPPPPPPPPQ